MRNMAMNTAHMGTSTDTVGRPPMGAPGGGYGGPGIFGVPWFWGGCDASDML